MTYAWVTSNATYALLYIDLRHAIMKSSYFIRKQVTSNTKCNNSRLSDVTKIPLFLNDNTSSQQSFTIPRLYIVLVINCEQPRPPSSRFIIRNTPNLMAEKDWVSYRSFEDKNRSATFIKRTKEPKKLHTASNTCRTLTTMSLQHCLSPVAFIVHT